MNIFSLALRDLRYYRRTNLAVALGVGVACAVLTGALLVGDSVRASLKRMSLGRLGRVSFAYESGERFFCAGLAHEVERTAGLPCAAVLVVPGTALSGDGSSRLPRVQVLGVDDKFWAFGKEGAPSPNPGTGEAFVNERTASALNLKPGDTLVLRIRKPGAMPGEVSFTRPGRETWSERLVVRAVASDARMGRFSLRISQLPPHSVFLARDRLAERLEIPGRANVLLASGAGKPGLEALEDALRRNWTLDDAGLLLNKLETPPAVELRSRRLFLEEPLENAALASLPEARGIFTYFVNEIRSKHGAVPYSFVSAPGAPLVPPDTGDDEIILNAWASEDLDADAGDRVEVRYFVLGPYRRLEEKPASFRVRAVVPLEGRAADRALVPDFPGLSGVESCSEWDPGIPVDLERVRDRDEEYWNRYRGTPKAFVTLNAAKELWGNPWGALTAVRFEGKDVTLEGVRDALRGRIPHSIFGPGFRDVRSEALKAGAESVDFARLFLGLSFFLIASSFLLTGLLFALGVEDRSREAGGLLALGYSPARVRNLFLLEGLFLVGLGCAAGVPGAVAFNEAVLWALGSLWRGAVGTSSLCSEVLVTTLLLGAGASALCGASVLWIALGRALRRPARALLAGPSLGAPGPGARGRWSFGVAILCWAGVIAVLLVQGPGRGREAALLFFGAGALLLLGGLAAIHAVVARMAIGRRVSGMNPRVLGLRQVARRRGRSLGAIALLSAGVFLVLAVGANRHDPRGQAGERASGTGGFAFYGETSLPVPHDLRTAEGRAAALLDGDGLEGVEIVPLRSREGDDASCLNLNRVSRPRLLGVDPDAFGRRGAFTFAELAGGADPERPWDVLEMDLPDGVVPGVADQTVIVWGLGKKLGDDIEYVDERGRAFRVRLVGGLASSIFQGSVLISSRHFRERYPSSPGAGVFLVDALPSGLDRVRSQLESALEDRGLVLVPATDRLAAFTVIENTYLDIFLMLGALGMLLGSAGLGVVVFRNVQERRRELAMFRALGFSRGRVFLVLLWEHGFLLAVGMALGMGAAGVAVMPSLEAPGARVPFLTLGVLLAVLFVSGFAWTAGASWLALSSELLPALHEE